jgi:hypothetical protein
VRSTKDRYAVKVVTIRRLTAFLFAAAMFAGPVHACSTPYGKPDGLKLVRSATWQFNGKCDGNEMVFSWRSATGRTNAPPGDPFIRPFENFPIIVIARS